MLVKCSIDTLEFENISHSVTLVPRLDYSINLLTGATGSFFFGCVASN